MAVVTKPFEFEGSRRGRTGRPGDRSPGRARRHADHHSQRPPAQVRRTQYGVHRCHGDGRRRSSPGRAGHRRHHHGAGVINRDFADVRTVMQGMGHAIMGIGTGSGEHRAVEAAQQAIASPLLEETSIEGARVCSSISPVAMASPLPRSTMPPRSSPRARIPTPRCSSERSSTRRWALAGHGYCDRLPPVEGGGFSSGGQRRPGCEHADAGRGSGGRNRARPSSFRRRRIPSTRRQHRRTSTRFRPSFGNR